MSKLKRVKTNGQPDNRFLERGDLERELVVKDKQTLITDCLKIFDTNTMLFEQLQALKEAGKEAAKAAEAFGVEIERLKARTFWAIINERIQWRIDKIRQRRTQTNYPTP